MKLNFFFDIDGTILPVGKPIPESAVKALHKAKSLGHRLFLCTGRSPFELTDELMALPFDGGVFSAGARLVLGGAIVSEVCMSEKQKSFFRKVIDDYNLLCLNQGPEFTYATQEAMDYYNILSLQSSGRTIQFKGFKIVDEIPWDEPIVKSYILSKEGRVLEARKALEGVISSVNNTTGQPETCAAEVMIQGVTKASGIAGLMKRLGDGIESTVGIGDGENDIEMIDVCSLGIAMGNSCDELKRHADYITTDINDDGLAKAIYYALERLS